MEQAGLKLITFHLTSLVSNRKFNLIHIKLYTANSAPVLKLNVQAYLNDIKNVLKIPHDWIC